MASTGARLMILVDTNVPLRLAQVGHPHYQPALDALATLATRDKEHFAIAPQSLYEMYVVMTRPAAQNGMGLTRRSHPDLQRSRPAPLRRDQDTQSIRRARRPAPLTDPTPVSP